MNAPDLEIREINEDEYFEYLQIAADAYPGIGIRTEEEIEKLIEKLKKRLEVGGVYVIGAFKEGKMVGGMRFHDYLMNIRGVMIKSGGLGGVAVHLAHKKERVAKKLVEYYLDYYNNQKYPMTILWPFRSDFYYNMGFGLGSPMYRYSIAPASFPPGETKKNVRYLTVDDTKEILECYNNFTHSHNGMIERNEKEIELFFEFTPEKRIVGCEIDNKIEGFMEFNFSLNSKANRMDNNLIVETFIANSGNAASQLCSFLHSQLDQITRVIFHTNDDYFYHNLKIPYTEKPEIFFPINMESFHAGVGLMYHILDLEKLYQELSIAKFGNGDLDVLFKIKYDFFRNDLVELPLSFSQGKINVCDSDKPKTLIEMSIADFSSLTMGSINLSSLLNFNRAKISNSDHIELLDQIFYSKQKPLCLTSF